MIVQLVTNLRGARRLAERGHACCIRYGMTMTSTCFCASVPTGLQPLQRIGCTGKWFPGASRATKVSNNTSNNRVSREAQRNEHRVLAAVAADFGSLIRELREEVCDGQDQERGT